MLLLFEVDFLYEEHSHGNGKNKYILGADILIKTKRHNSWKVLGGLWRIFQIKINILLQKYIRVYLVYIKRIFKAYNAWLNFILKKSTVRCVWISRTNLTPQSNLSSVYIHRCHIIPFNELKLYIRFHNVAYFILCTSSNLMKEFNAWTCIKIFKLIVHSAKHILKLKGAHLFRNIRSVLVTSHNPYTSEAFIKRPT